MKQLITISLARVAFSAYSLLLLIMLGRELSPDELASFAYIDSLKILFCFAPIVGVSQAYIKNYRSRQHDRSSFVAYFFVLISYLSVFTISYAVVSQFFEIEFYLYVFFLCNILYMFGRGGLLAEKNEMYLFAYEVTLLTVFVFSIAVLDFTKWNLSDWLFLASFSLLSPSIVIGVYAALSKKLVYRKCDRRNVKSNLYNQLNYIKYSLPNNFASNIFSIIDSFVLGTFLGNIVLADYKAAKIIMSGYVLIGEIINAFVFPKFSEFRINRDIKLNVIVGYFKIVLMLSVVSTIVVNLFAYDVLSILYDGKYDNDNIKQLILFISLWGSVFILVRTVASNLGAIGLPDVLMKTTFWSGGVSVVFLIYLVDLLGLIGLGISLLINAIVPALVLFLLAKNQVLESHSLSKQRSLL